jgi:hypothetical protein
VARDRDANSILMPVLDPVAKSDEKLEIPANRIVVLDPPLAGTSRELPKLRLAIDPDEAPPLVGPRFPVPVVNRAAQKLSMEQI